MLLFFKNAGTLLPISGLTKYPLHKKEKPGFVLKSTQKVQKVQIQYKSPVFDLYCILRNTLAKMRTFHMHRSEALVSKRTIWRCNFEC